GHVRITEIAERRAAATTVTVGLVQGNQPIEMSGYRDRAATELAELQRVSAELEAQGAELLVWSEAAYTYPLYRQQSSDRVISDHASDDPARIRRGFTVPAVIGAITLRRGRSLRNHFNSALMLEPDGRITGQYDKIYLLLFGEYLPGYELLGPIRQLVPPAAGRFVPGERVTVLPFVHDQTHYRLAPMICYEDILPGLGRELAEYRPHLLVNLTNDAWFGDSAEPWQHLALSVFRAVEMRTDMVRAVNTGVSAFITADGRITAHSQVVDPHLPDRPPIPASGLLGRVALVEGGHTVFARYGDWLGYSCAALTLLGCLVWPLYVRRKRSDTTEIPR
ncbi:MAG: apolipoprotein N-acyltransferase, partial [Myxococcota bacterium]